MNASENLVENIDSTLYWTNRLNSKQTQWSLAIMRKYFRIFLSQSIWSYGLMNECMSVRFNVSSKISIIRHSVILLIHWVVLEIVQV
jgi:hypothetical protein